MFAVVGELCQSAPQPMLFAGPVKSNVPSACFRVRPPPSGSGHRISCRSATKSPVHIPDLAPHHELNSAGEAEEYVSKIGVRTLLIVPMLRNDELIGSLAIGRQRIEPFTEKEIELVTDFAAEAAIAMEITRRERELRELQMELARANRIATMEQLSHLSPMRSCSRSRRLAITPARLRTFWRSGRRIWAKPRKRSTCCGRSRSGWRHHPPNQRSHPKSAAEDGSVRFK
jgi:hypothetical protein